MNKYQEALEKVLDATYEDDYLHSFSVHRQDDEEIKALQELVDRATPKKANEIDFVCPNCNHDFCNYEGLYDGTLIGDFCQFCGQALEWEKD